MLKVENVSVKGYEFTGYVNIECLNAAQLDALRILNPDEHETGEIEVFGEFSVYASKDDTIIESNDIHYIRLVSHFENKEFYVDFPNSDFDTKQLAQDLLAEDDGTWYENSKDDSDSRYDAWVDSQYD